MQHETKMENQSWLKKLARRLGPGHVVNLCFIVVLLFSTLLTWREVVVLEDAYISSQRNHLENVANALDKHLQYNVDKLIFLRNGMREALVAPLDFTSLRNAVTEFRTASRRARLANRTQPTTHPASQWCVGCISQRGESPVSRK